MGEEVDTEVRLYATLRAAAGRTHLSLQLDAPISARALIALLVSKAPELHGLILGEDGELREFVNVFVGENRWGELGPRGARGSCSSMVYWNPRVILDVWSKVAQQDWQAVAEWSRRICALHEFLVNEYGPQGLTDTAYDRLGGLASGFLKTSLRSREPYPSVTDSNVIALRDWYRSHFPEMLQI